MTIYIATQNVRISVNGRSIDLQTGQFCDISDEEASHVAPGLLVRGTQAETVSTEASQENNEEPRFERKKGKR